MYPKYVSKARQYIFLYLLSFIKLFYIFSKDMPLKCCITGFKLVLFFSLTTLKVVGFRISTGFTHAYSGISRLPANPAVIYPYIRLLLLPGCFLPTCSVLPVSCPLPGTLPGRKTLQRLQAHTQPSLPVQGLQAF